VAALDAMQKSVVCGNRHTATGEIEVKNKEGFWRASAMNQVNIVGVGLVDCTDGWSARKSLPNKRKHSPSRNAQRAVDQTRFERKNSKAIERLVFKRGQLAGRFLNKESGALVSASNGCNHHQQRVPRNARKRRQNERAE